ncbi:MAG: winged helix-turn-helix transcriptional regulator [Bacilli bacterium]|nr:winged helix-turn-helix transcriptional regulator [Bacilli bacterium]
MSSNAFFKPTPLYKEFMILDLIEKNKNITQREMSIAIGVAVSMINSYVDGYEQKGYIKRKYLSTKTVEYFVTKKGLERRKVLNIGYLNASQNLYNSAKENIERFLIQIKEKGFKNIFLYGAGEVAELLLHTLKSNNVICINVLGVIDDDEKRIGLKIDEIDIISIKKIEEISHDGILISSYAHSKNMISNLVIKGYSKDKIITFFDYEEIRI